MTRESSKNSSSSQLRVVSRLQRRFLYPWSDGSARRKDPTYGKIDRDIQWAVWDEYPNASLASRCIIELNVQLKRDRGWTRP